MAGAPRNMIRKRLDERGGEEWGEGGDGGKEGQGHGERSFLRRRVGASRRRRCWTSPCPSLLLPCWVGASLSS